MKRYISVEDDNEQTASNIKVSLKDTNNISGLQRYYLTKENFHQIDKNLLLSHQEVNFSIFISKDFDFKAAFEATLQSPKKISSEILDMQGDIFIKACDIPLYSKYLESLQEADITDQYAMQLIKEKSKIIIRDVLTDPKNEDNIKNISSTVEKIADSILDNRDAIYDLISTIHRDYYLYVHSINVAVLSIGLGTAIGLTRNEIFNLGFGAILHDIGKSDIPIRILNKPDRLTAHEFKIMKGHVFEGQRILMKHKFFPKDSMPAITQHHEKLSGKGYPLGIKAPDIKLYGKITAIADCYDSLTTRNPYKYSLSPFSALNILVKETENYDRELLETFIKLLGRIKI